jgi:hypothetical protein
MSSIYAAGNATLPGPVPLDTLNSALMVADGVHDPRAPSFQLTGFDIDHTCACCACAHLLPARMPGKQCANVLHLRTRARSDLLFHKILGVRILYVVRQTYLELYLALREGACDVGITAAELCARACGGAVRVRLLRPRGAVAARAMRSPRRAPAR